MSSVISFIARGSHYKCLLATVLVLIVQQYEPIQFAFVADNSDRHPTERTDKNAVRKENVFFSVCGPEIWNSPPPNIRNINLFWRSVKEHWFREAVHITGV